MLSFDLFFYFPFINYSEYAHIIRLSTRLMYPRLKKGDIRSSFGKVISKKTIHNLTRVRILSVVGATVYNGAERLCDYEKKD